MKEEIEIIRAARRLIEKPEMWTRDVLARDSKGVQVPYKSKGATCFCIVGSVRRAASEISASEHSVIVALSALTESSEYKGIVSFNDNPETKHEDVINTFNKAEKLLESMK